MQAELYLKEESAYGLPLEIQGQTITIHLKPEERYPLRALKKAGRLCDQLGFKHINFAGHHWHREAMWAFYQGYTRPYKAGEVLFPQQDQILKDWLTTIDWAKHQVNLGPADCTPEKLSHAAIQFLQTIGGQSIRSEIIRGQDLLKQGFVGCYHVGRGSINEPHLTTIHYQPEGIHSPIKPKLILVGKGICFDSGGYQMKAPLAIATMKNDMAGAASVTAALGLAILSGLKEPVSIILCAAENLVGQNAYKPGDILHYKNGLSVEIQNTDAEGRLVLADGLIRAQEIGTPYIVDVATLTGAAMVGVGMDYSALFGFNDSLIKSVLDLARSEQELLWPLPLTHWHKELMASPLADTFNALAPQGLNFGGASTAAAFLSRFIKDQEAWLHFDLASAYRPSDKLHAGGATGDMIKTLAKLILHLAK